MNFVVRKEAEKVPHLYTQAIPYGIRMVPKGCCQEVPEERERMRPNQESGNICPAGCQMLYAHNCCESSVFSV